MLNRFLKPLLVAVMVASGLHDAKAADLIVSAAASLTNSFTELGRAYEQENPGTSIVLNFAGSGTLLQQISRGAPVDVLASADEETMDLAQNRQLIVAASRVDFAHNVLVLIAPSDSRLLISKLAQLRSNDVDRIAVSNPASVPVGRYSRQVLMEAGLWEVLEPKYINTQHVRQSLDYVARGEVDVGFVYATDARVMPDKVRVLMQVTTNTPIAYPIAVVADSREPVAANRFIEFVRSARGQSILLRYGFGAP